MTPRLRRWNSGTRNGSIATAAGAILLLVSGVRQATEGHWPASTMLLATSSLLFFVTGASTRRYLDRSRART